MTQLAPTENNKAFTPILILVLVTIGTSLLVTMNALAASLNGSESPKDPTIHNVPLFLVWVNLVLLVLSWAFVLLMVKDGGKSRKASVGLLIVLGLCTPLAFFGILMGMVLS
jgi:hypothetical protein